MWVVNTSTKRHLNFSIAALREKLQLLGLRPTMMSVEKEDDYIEIPIEDRTWKDLNTIQLVNFFFL